MEKDEINLSGSVIGNTSGDVSVTAGISVGHTVSETVSVNDEIVNNSSTTVYVKPEIKFTNNQEPKPSVSVGAHLSK